MNDSIPTQAVVVRDSRELVPVDQPLPPPSLFGTSEPHEIIAKATTVASALKDVLKAQKLISNIQGREYPRCEAWTLLGTMLGVFPVLVWTKQIEGGWEARVEARTRDGCVVGAAEAECLRSEKNWNNRDDYALRSMAQTRATAKALRMPLGFVMTLAGYEATPAEEMPPNGGDHYKPTLKPKDASKANSGAKKATNALADILKASKAKFIENVRTEGRLFDAWVYAVETGTILENEQLDDARVEVLFPSAKEEMDVEQAKLDIKHDYETMMSDIRAHTILEKDHGSWHEKFTHAYNENKPKPKLADKMIEVPREQEPWRVFPMPWGKKAGVQLGKLDKKYLFGLWANYEVETEYNGKTKSAEQIAKDRTFRAMLDDAGEHYEFVHPDDKQEFRDEHDE